MKYAFFETLTQAEDALESINEALGINNGTYGIPRGLVKTYGMIEEIDGRWGFPVGTTGAANVDHLVDTEEYEPEEDDGES